RWAWPSGRGPVAGSTTRSAATSGSTWARSASAWAPWPSRSRSARRGRFPRWCRVRSPLAEGARAPLGGPFRWRRSGVRDPRPVLGDRAAVHAQVEAGDHLGVVAGQEHGGAGVVSRAREPAGRHHLLEVEHPAAAAVGSWTAPRHRALEGLFAIG